MKINQRGLEIIKESEGLEIKSYLCPAKVWTIGFGHTKDVKPGDIITEEEAETLLKQDLKETEDNLSRMNKESGANLTENQFSALVSWIFNLGIGNFRDSSLWQLVKDNPNNDNKMSIDQASGNVVKFLRDDKIDELGLIEYNFLRWCNASREPYLGLYIRRKKEYDLFAS